MKSALKNDLSTSTVICASDLMRGMQGKWCRSAWRGREDIAITLTTSQL
ncbi:hypothetical protein [Prosthecobacter sp.]